MDLHSHDVQRWIAAAPALALLVVAAVEDARRRRIPNWVTGTLAASGILVAGLRLGAVGALYSAGAALLGLALLFLPFALGLLGAGDVKLVAASGAWLGAIGVLWLVPYSAIAGGVLALLYYLRAPTERRQIVRANLTAVAVSPSNVVSTLRSAPRERGVPYGIAIALVAAVMLVKAG